MKKCFVLLRTVLFILVLIYFLSFSIQADNNEAMDIIINDAFVKNGPKVETINGIDYIPLSKLQDNLGIKVYFNEQDGGYYIYWWSNFLYINREKNIIKVNGEYKSSEYPLEIMDDTLCIPADMMISVFGFKTERIGEIKGFRIITKDEVLPYESLVKLKQEADKLKASSIKYNGPKVAYITFDDGIVRANAEKILDILKEKNVKATFFVLGNTINKNQDILKRMAEEGHSIGNHSYSHKKEIIYKDSKSLMSEVEKTSKLIKDAVGKVLKLFRPPYGSPYIKNKSYQEALKDYKIVLWNVDSNDSRVKDIKAEEIYNNVIAQVENKKSAVILFHETKVESIKALPKVIDYLINNGFEIKPIDEDTLISYK